MNVQYKGYKRKGIKVRHRVGDVSGMGVRFSGAPADALPYPRIKSAKRFIKFVDGVTCLTFLYECFGYTGYGCKKVECIHREEQTLLERYGDRLCWK